MTAEPGKRSEGFAAHSGAAGEPDLTQTGIHRLNEIVTYTLGQRVSMPIAGFVEKKSAI